MNDSATDSFHVDQEGLPEVSARQVRTIMPFEYVNTALSLMFIAVWAMVGQILASDRRNPS